MADFWSQFGPAIGGGATQAAGAFTPQVGPPVNQTMQSGQATLLSGGLPPNYALPGGPNINPVSPDMGTSMTGGTNAYQPGPGGTQPPQAMLPNLADPGAYDDFMRRYNDPNDTSIIKDPFGYAGLGDNYRRIVQQQHGQQPGGAFGGGGDYQAEFMQAIQALGVSPQQFRSNPEVMNRVTQYLSQKYPGQNWTNGGQRAGDWVSVNGQGFDVLPAGDAKFQWLSDPAGSQAGNPNDPSGFQTGTFTGGGQYPLASVMGTGLAQPWTTPFTAPDNLTEQNDPGFQARMKMGTDAIQRSAASKGTLLTGGLLKGLDRYAQDFASNEYSNVYNRALGQYQQAYGIFNNNQGNLFNRLSSLGSVGENAAAGTGNLYQDIGNAQATGSNAQGNIWGNAINQGANTIGGLVYMNQQRNQPSSTFPTNSAP